MQCMGNEDKYQKKIYKRRFKEHKQWKGKQFKIFINIKKKLNSCEKKMFHRKILA